MSTDAVSTAHSRGTIIVAALAFTGIVVSLMQTLVIPIIPMLPQYLHTSTSSASWVVTATLLAGAVATPMAGRLGDMFGKRRILLLSLVLLTVGSLVGALSTTLVPMIIGRALQGLAAGVIPLGISVMRDVLPKERLNSSTAVMSASLGVGGALGLPAAAFIAENASWHMLFWVSTVVGIVAFALVLTIVPESPMRAGGSFDLVGALGLSVALVCLLLAVSKGADWGWTGGITLGLFAAAVVVLLVWGAWELRRPSPLVDLRVSARPQVLLTNLSSMVFGFSMFASSLVFPQLMELPTETGVGLGKSLIVVGLVMAPNGIVMMAIAPLSSRITNSRGPRVTLMLGALVVGAGYLLALVLSSSVWQLVIVLMVMGAGIGLAYGAMPALIMGAVPLSETGSANGLNTLMRSVGTSVASAAIGALLGQMTQDFHGTPLPTEHAFQVVFVVAAAAAIIAMGIAACIPRSKTLSAQPQDAEGNLLDDPDAVGARR